MRIPFTAEDRNFLAAHAIVVGDEGAVPMIAVARYVAAVDAGDRALAEVHRLRTMRRRWRQRYRRSRRDLALWRCAALLSAAALVCAWIGRIGW